MPTERTDREKVIFLAERVMGWKQHARYSEGRVTFAREDGTIIALGGRLPSWNPLTDPAASSQVIDRMIERGWCYQITQRMGEIRTCFWIVLGTVGTYFDFTGQTRELAVADASIAAIEGGQA